MIGDLYDVRYQMGTRGTYTDTTGPFDKWLDAKEARNRKFYDFDNVTACWIERQNPSMNLVPERYGAVMRRDRK